VNGRLSPIPGDPVGELSYSTMMVNQNGTILREEDTDTDMRERYLDPLSLAKPSTIPPLPDFVREGSTYAQSLVDRIASIPSYEDDSADLEPPSLAGMTEGVSRTTICNVVLWRF
jgi:hypothetical protein